MPVFHKATQYCHTAETDPKLGEEDHHAQTYLKSLSQRPNPPLGLFLSVARFGVVMTADNATNVRGKPSVSLLKPRP